MALFELFEAMVRVTEVLLAGLLETAVLLREPREPRKTDTNRIYESSTTNSPSDIDRPALSALCSGCDLFEAA